jgi:hypothetical protein
MARTMPPTRITTGTTAVAFGGVAPIDAYGESIDRPLAYFESTATTCLATASASIPCLYIKATLTAGMSGNISATAAAFKTHAGGQAVGKISGIASYVELDDGFTGYTGGIDVSGVITPLNVAVRAHPTGTVTLTTTSVIFGLHAQYLPGTGTVAPTYLFFARLNTGGTAAAGTLTALFYAENPQSAGWVTGHLSSVAVGRVPLIYVHSAGDVAGYVNLWAS